MESTGNKRKLAATLMADGVGYGRLMGEDGPGKVVDFEAAGIANPLNLARIGVRGGLEVPGRPCPTRGRRARLPAERGVGAWTAIRSFAEGNLR